MGRVRVITDSSACVPAELVAKFGVCVLPISVFLPEDGAAGLDPSNGQGAILPEALAREELAGANHPFVTEYLQAIESPDFDAAVVITPAIEFATMYRNAALAAEFATRPVVLVDARTAAAGQALVVLAGAEAAAKGAGIEEVVRVVEEAARRVELVASLATLEPIRRSGPVPDDVLGELDPSGMRSVFRMRDGTVEPIGTAATAEETLEMIHAAYAVERARAGPNAQPSSTPTPRTWRSGSTNCLGVPTSSADSASRCRCIPGVASSVPRGFPLERHPDLRS